MKETNNNVNKVFASERVLSYLEEKCNINNQDAIAIISKFESLHDLTDDEIMSVFDENHENHEEYADMIEFVWKNNAKEMFIWMNEYNEEGLSDYIIPENCAGKTLAELAEIYVANQDNAIILSDGKCLFQYV